MLKWIERIFYRLVQLESSAKRLTLSFCWGVFVALSPFLGLHTVMLIGLSWVFDFNIAVAFLTANLVSNPLTVLFIKTLEYFVGYFLIHDILGFDLMPYNPAWMDWLNQWIERYFHMHGIGIWYFLIGGTLIAILGALIAYPATLPLFKKLERRYKKIQCHEDYSAK